MPDLDEVTQAHGAAVRPAKPNRRVLPGFSLSLGIAVSYLSLIVLIPLAGVFLRASDISWQEFWEIISSRQVVASFKISFGISLLAAITNAGMGLITAWVLVRYNFPGKRIFDAIVDLPFALPTAVAGIALTTIFAQNGILGQIFYPLGLKTAYSQLGIYIALTFIGLPFVIRTLQPVLEDLDTEVEEAAATLGASRRQTFVRVIFPAILPAWLTGFAMAYARSIGEYGSIIFISGNMPLKTEITPLVIVKYLENFQYSHATAVAAVMLVASFFILLVINLLQRWTESIGKARR